MMISFNNLSTRTLNRTLKANKRQHLEIKIVPNATPVSVEKSMKNSHSKEFVNLDGFYHKLGTAYPNLTRNEKRLCGFLKLNFSSREISESTGQSIHAIEVARVRLRKKLNITGKKFSLITFMDSI